MTSKLKAHSSFGRFARSPLPRTEKCTKCDSPFHVALMCPRDRKPLRANPHPKDEPTAAEKAHMARVRTLRCKALGQPGHERCSGPMVAHHAGQHGTGAKCSHYDTVPLCDTAHSQLHDMPGNGWTAAAGLDGEGIRQLENEWIETTHDELGVDSNGPIDGAKPRSLMPF
jgi:hypothetical protein